MLDGQHMEPLVPGDLVEVIDRPGIVWDRFCKPGYQGVVLTEAFKPDPRVEGDIWAVAHKVRFVTGTVQVARPLLRKIAPPPEDCGVMYEDEAVVWLQRILAREIMRSLGEPL